MKSPIIWTILSLSILFILAIFRSHNIKRCPTCDNKQDKNGDCEIGCKHREDVNY